MQTKIGVKLEKKARVDTRTLAFVLKVEEGATVRFPFEANLDLFEKVEAYVLARDYLTGGGFRI